MDYHPWFHLPSFTNIELLQQPDGLLHGGGQDAHHPLQDGNLQIKDKKWKWNCWVLSVLGFMIQGKEEILKFYILYQQKSVTPG